MGNFPLPNLGPNSWFLVVSLNVSLNKSGFKRINVTTSPQESLAWKTQWKWWCKKRFHDIHPPYMRIKKQHFVISYGPKYVVSSTAKPWFLVLHLDFIREKETEQKKPIDSQSWCTFGKICVFPKPRRSMEAVSTGSAWEIVGPAGWWPTKTMENHHF